MVRNGAVTRAAYKYTIEVNKLLHKSHFANVVMCLLKDVLHPTELDAEEDEEEVDVIVIDDAVGGVQDGPSHIMDGSHLVKIRKAFLDKKRARTISGDKLSSSFAPPPTTSMAAGKPNLERGHSCPINLTSRQVSLDAPSRRRPLTGNCVIIVVVVIVCLYRDF